MADEPLFCHSLLVTSMESRGSFAFLSGRNEAINLIDDSKLLSFQVLHLLFLSIKQIDFIGFCSITKKIKWLPKYPKTRKIGNTILEFLKDLEYKIHGRNALHFNSEGCSDSVFRRRILFEGSLFSGNNSLQGCEISSVFLRSLDSGTATETELRTEILGFWSANQNSPNSSIWKFREISANQI